MINNRTEFIPVNGARLIALLFCLVLALHAAPEKRQHVNAELIAEVESLQPGTPFWVGLWLKIDEHWHVYWRNPGDSGAPVSIEWDLPDGFQASDLHWPTPQQLMLFDMVNYGYENEVLLLCRITPPAELDSASTVALQARADWLVCEEICVPEAADLQLSMPVRDAPPAADDRWRRQFADSRLQLPFTDAGYQYDAQWGDSTFTLSIRSSDDSLAGIDSLYFFPYRPDMIRHAARQPLTSSGGTFQLTLAISPYRQQRPERVRGILVADRDWRSKHPGRALEIDAPVSVKPVGRPADRAQRAESDH